MQKAVKRDADWMAIALDMARLGLGKTSPNPAVGAVLVKNGKMLAAGFHRKAGLAHAEVEAMRSLTPSLSRGGRGGLRGATLYVTLEPCCHYGRTPPCTDAILKSGIREVVVGMKDPDLKVAGKGIRVLKKAGVKVRVGVLQKECEELNQAYLKHRRTGLPYVILKSASTLDGRVATASGESKWITGEAAREFGHGLRNQVDAILVGRETIRKDDPLLTTRLKQIKGKNPVRIILDSHLKLRSAKVFDTKAASTWVATTVSPKNPRVLFLKKKGVQVVICRSAKGQVDLKDLLKQIGRRGIVSLLVEGGPTVHSAFVKEKLADKLVLFLAPSLLGSTARPLLSGLAIPTLSRRLRLSHTTCLPIGEDWLMEGQFVW